MKPRPLLAALALAALIAFVAGCGGGSSSGSKVAELAPPGAPVFVEGTLQPDRRAEVEHRRDRRAGRRNRQPRRIRRRKTRKLGAQRRRTVRLREGNRALAGRARRRLLRAARRRQRIQRRRRDRRIDRHRRDPGIHRQAGQGSTIPTAAPTKGSTTRSAARKATRSAWSATSSSSPKSEKVFKEVVDASEGESLAAEDTFSKAISAASDGSLADVYVDVGKLIDQSGGQIDPTARQILQNAGIDPSEATAVASIVPGSDQVAVELSSDLAGQEAPTGDASSLLGELPGDAFAGFAVSGFGKQLNEAIDSLDKQGIPGTIPPNQLKKGLKQLGIDLEGFANSVQDAGVVRHRQQRKQPRRRSGAEHQGLERDQHDLQHRHAAAQRPRRRRHRARRQVQRLLGPQRRTRQQAARRRRQGRADRDRLRPAGDARTACSRKRARARRSPKTPPTATPSPRSATRRSAASPTARPPCASPTR